MNVVGRVGQRRRRRRTVFGRSYSHSHSLLFSLGFFFKSGRDHRLLVLITTQQQLQGHIFGKSIRGLKKYIETTHLKQLKLDVTFRRFVRKIKFSMETV